MVIKLIPPFFQQNLEQTTRNVATICIGMPIEDFQLVDEDPEDSSSEVARLYGTASMQ